MLIVRSAGSCTDELLFLKLLMISYKGDTPSFYIVKTLFGAALYVQFVHTRIKINFIFLLRTICSGNSNYELPRQIIFSYD